MRIHPDSTAAITAQLAISVVFLLPGDAAEEAPLRTKEQRLPSEGLSDVWGSGWSQGLRLRGADRSTSVGRLRVTCRHFLVVLLGFRPLLWSPQASTSWF